MNHKYLPLLALLLPCMLNAQLRTGSATLYIGKNTSVTVLGKVTLLSDVAGPGNLIMNGNTLQAIDGGGANIPNLVINNASDVKLVGDAVISSSLTFTVGKIFTNNQLLTLAPAAIMQGYSTTQYISTSDTDDNAATTGGFQLTVPAGTGVLVPVGANSGSYNPVTINNNSGPDEQYTTRVSPTPAPGPNASTTLNMSWNITEATPGGNKIGLALQWKAGAGPAGFDRNHAKIVRSNGVSIVEKTGFLSATGANPYIITGGAFTGASIFGLTSDVNAFAMGAVNNTDESKMQPESISMFPTLVKGNTASLVIKVPAQTKYVYIINDMSGKIIAKKDISIFKGDNIVPVTLPVLASGIYMINVYDGTVLKKSIKFVKG